MTDHAQESAKRFATAHLSMPGKFANYTVEECDEILLRAHEGRMSQEIIDGWLDHRADAARDEELTRFKQIANEAGLSPIVEDAA